MTNVKEIISETLKKKLDIVFLGYSPTGGGHTARTYNIIKEAIKNKKIKNNSTIIVHLPITWENKDNSDLLKEYFKGFIKDKLNIIIIKNNKPVYGYLKDNGGSNNNKIIKRFALYNPNSDKKNTNNIMDGIIFSGNEKLDFETIPTISSKNLIESFCNLVKEIDKKNSKKILEENVYVLSDMSPDLIKAACKSEISKHHILDQQNHGILLEKFINMENIKNINLYDLGRYAYLSKILGGYGNKISHIELGNKNTLLNFGDHISVKKDKNNNSIKITVEGKKNKIIATNLKKNIIHKTIDSLFEMKNLIIDFNNKDKITDFKPGIYVSKPIKDIKIEQIDSIISIYAHSNTNNVMKIIYDEIEKNKSKYENIIFIVCGNVDSDYNLIHLSYLLDANFILTSGAGTSGEYLYLKNKTNNKGKLLLLPILGHEEQLENAKFLKTSKFKEDIYICENNEDLNKISLEFLNNITRYNEIDNIDKETIDDFINAVKNNETYAEQACDLLFEEKKQDITLKNLEEKLQNDIYLKLVRRFIKLIFSSLEALSKNNDKVNIKMKNKDVYKEYDIINIGKMFSENNIKENISNIQSILSLENIKITKEQIESLPGLNLFIELIFEKGDKNKLINQLKEELSNYFITGF